MSGKRPIDGYPFDLEFLKECARVTEGYEKLWGRWSVDSQLFHIVCEIAELKDVLRNKKEKFGKHGSSEYLTNVKDELADVFLTTFALANYLGLDDAQLNAAVLEKLAEVENRLQEAKSEAEQFAKEAIDKASQKK